MVDFNTSLNLPLNVRIDTHSGQSSNVEKLKAISPEDFGTYASRETLTDFASAFYGDGPYSLEHPNNTTELVAQNVDYLA